MNADGMETFYVMTEIRSTLARQTVEKIHGDNTTIGPALTDLFQDLAARLLTPQLRTQRVWQKGMWT